MGLDSALTDSFLRVGLSEIHQLLVWATQRTQAGARTSALPPYLTVDPVEIERQVDEALLPQLVRRLAQHPIDRVGFYPCFSDLLCLSILAPAFPHAPLALLKLQQSPLPVVRAGSTIALLYCGASPKGLDYSCLIEAGRTVRYEQLPEQILRVVVPLLEPAFAAEPRLANVFLDAVQKSSSGGLGVFGREVHIALGNARACVGPLWRDIIENLIGQVELGSIVSHAADRRELDAGDHFEMRYFGRARRALAALVSTEPAALARLVEPILDSWKETPEVEIVGRLSVFEEIEPREARDEILTALMQVAEQTDGYYTTPAVKSLVHFANSLYTRDRSLQILFSLLDQDALLPQVLAGLAELVYPPDDLRTRVLALASQVHALDWHDLKGHMNDSGIVALLEGKLDEAKQKEDRILIERTTLALQQLRGIS